MIENRFRIEKQILLGRQAARTTIERVRSRGNPGNSRNLVFDGQVVPEPITGTQLLTTAVRFESPTPMDSDAERAVVDDVNTRYSRLFRSATDTPRGSRTSPPYENGYNGTPDPLRSPAFRRKWASDLLGPGATSSPAGPRSVTPEAPVDDSGGQKPSSSTFSTKIGSESLPGLSIPLLGSRRASRFNGKGLSVGASEMAWSSGSSSGDDSGQLEPRLNPNTDFNQEAISDGVDSD